MVGYDGKRKDITFCTMLFRMPQSDSLKSLKKKDRDFDDFYLLHLKTLIKTFKHVALWCDKYIATVLKREGIDKQIDMRVLSFDKLPYYKEREEWLKILHGMKKYVGFLLHRKTPEQWIDYLILINSKPAVVDWAAKRNKFKSKYFMWVDVGALNPEYEYCWANWDGTIKAKPTRVRMPIHVTTRKTRPHFVPEFLFRLQQKWKKPIPLATKENLQKQRVRSIAMINADYDVPACCFMMPHEMVHKFYLQYEKVRHYMKQLGYVSTEQAVFQTMLKLDTQSMFELCYETAYIGAYTVVVKEKADYVL